MNVPLTKPCTGDEESHAVAEVIRSGWLTQGQAVADFERAVAHWTGAQHAVACSNCTAALHLSLHLLDLRPGDEVIVPSYTWIATANAVCMAGATPRFADIDLDTLNIAPRDIEAALTPRTRAIVPVHQFGMPADLDAIERIAQGAGVAVVEDAACALGSRHNGREIGGTGRTACFSFHPRKVVTTGEGGMLLTNDARLAARARVFLNHGASVSDVVKHAAASVEALLAEAFDEVGYNYRMTNLQGALGVVQMTRLEGLLALRRARGAQYAQAFARVDSLVLPAVPAYATPNWQSYAVRIEGGAARRDRVAQRLLDAGIACRPAYMACHVQAAYRHFQPAHALANTQAALDSVLILPLYPQMTDSEQGYVVDKLRQALGVL